MCPICPGTSAAAIIHQFDAPQNGVPHHPGQHLAGDGSELCDQQLLWWKQADCKYVN